MNTPLKPLDIYGDMRIPFDVGTFCRGHKFSVEAVNLTRALDAENLAKRKLAQAEDFLAQAEQMRNEAIAAVRAKMEKTDGV